MRVIRNCSRYALTLLHVESGGPFMDNGEQGAGVNFQIGPHALSISWSLLSAAVRSSAMCGKVITIFLHSQDLVHLSFCQPITRIPITAVGFHVTCIASEALNRFRCYGMLIHEMHNCTVKLAPNTCQGYKLTPTRVLELFGK
jgi:hypothetical protein